MSQGYVEMLLGIPRANDAGEAVANIQKLEEFVREYKHNKDK